MEECKNADPILTSFESCGAFARQADPSPAGLWMRAEELNTPDQGTLRESSERRMLHSAGAEGERR